MPKYPSDRRQYYDEMGDRRAVGRTRNRGRPQDTEQRDSRARAQQTGEQISSRRPGESAGPSRPHSTPYARPSTSSGAPSTSYSGGGEPYEELVRPTQQHRPQPAFSETTSVAGSVGGESTSAGRGSLRGRRILPENIITRPRTLETKQGTFGKPVNLISNYFKLLSTTDWCLNKYNVTYEPEEDRNVIRKGLLRAHRETLGAYIFDGSVLYTSRLLPQPLQLTSERLHDNAPVLLTFTHVGDMTRGDHHYIQFFNIIMRKCLDYLKLQLVGRNYFDASNKVEIRDYKFELWPGYITSIRQHENDILMCAEITHKVMRRETLLHILEDCYRKSPHDYEELFTRQVLGIVVLTDYNNNTYRIDDVDFSSSPMKTFAKKDGTQISFVDYYQSKYQITIRNRKQPLLVSRSKPRDRRGGQEEVIHLIPELCRSTGLTDAMRNDFRLMAALAIHTRVSPAERIKKLMTFNRRLHAEPNVTTELQSWNLTLDRALINVRGRVIPCDKINFGDNASVTVNNTANWTNDIRDKSLLKRGHLSDWVLCVPGKWKRDCQGFVQSLKKVAYKMNFEIENPYVVDLQDDNASTYAQILEQVRSKMNPMLIFCVASNNRVDRYSAIKKKCCVDRPVPTQVVLAKNLSNPKTQMSIATKVAIQMNCKIGGIPWSVTIPLSGLMVVGFDVCHDTSFKDKDFGAMVASLDSNFGRYFSAVSSHSSGEELSNDLSVNLCKALKEFKEYNNSLPKKIVIYRDGVGEGQIPFVLQHEVQQIRSKLEKVYENPEDVKLAYVIVTKKINTRLFAAVNNDYKNPAPGTVVDDYVTDPTKYDFFIVSQHVGQGTVSPTSYNVIWDTSGLDADKLQRLTYKLCHMYFNWSGTVRVPAPCQYAHKLAFLVAQAIHQSPHTSLETLLYFL